ncbi:Spo0B domain-containing protein [Paenibacillus cremeus]|uniref:SpoOB alpha-helical domain-containing protein n=1 Tax=Paenibacillus cremeus TaxID=2163881 RepID=A0A559KIF7_9BACL|nr:Spo0B domain-containing protein [Paenibacillus cremeus]TVY11915.1 hypothetical protein FPZ49_01110 [Paenibacillus cremeus]
MTSNAKQSTSMGDSGRVGASQAALNFDLDRAEADLRLLRLFNRYRHDWMNDIQIFMGYVQLKKYDKLTDLMEKIKEKVRQESLMSKLGIPSLIVHLLTFQAEVKELELHVRMEEEIRLQDYGVPEETEQWLAALLDSFKAEAMAAVNECNALELYFAKEADGLGITADYQGGYDLERLKLAEATLCKAWLAGRGWVLEASYSEIQVKWTVRLQRT